MCPFCRSPKRNNSNFYECGTKIVMSGLSGLIIISSICNCLEKLYCAEREYKNEKNAQKTENQ
jgi:hypothetical protein